MWINIVEDEKNLNTILKTYLEKEGYSVRSFLNGNDAIEAIGLETDLWVIDIMLPDTNGFTVFNKIKEITPNAYIIFISARNQEIDRLVGLEMGCDDYISKPFMTRELIIRVNKLLKMSAKDRNILKAGKYKIYLDRHKVFCNQNEIELSAKEYDLLVYFLENPNIALSREQILERIWDNAYQGSQRVVDDTVRRIRKKMPELKIETVYGYGYTYEKK
ncbi:response regulator transcription factor [Paramaledivibacter caminithermalis]|jgi:two-component system response regulator CssR|uniref:Stage 0 sporulation protein A homolog n=1 Tax=Paramaledivibacter caminithermalis (strain DSM 15212 / CIP 107654 / DViRD3) TaxID=1121301 RepID=A0A1M6REB2_PARC5|nr:response regulator transcription factor [Paramaledivibacter caminithermalis]SHK30753.1 two-component system, OmpR family, response regulator CssR [Paramaledivibacter caminithermalis DSM 15212]